MLNNTISNRRKSQMALRKALEEAAVLDNTTRAERREEEKKFLEAQNRLALGTYAQKRKLRLFEEGENYIAMNVSESVKKIICNIIAEAALVDELTDEDKNRVYVLVSKFVNEKYDGSNPILSSVIKYIPEYDVGINLEPTIIPNDVCEKVIAENKNDIATIIENIENSVSAQVEYVTELAKTFKGELDAVAALPDGEVVRKPVIDPDKSLLFTLIKNEAMNQVAANNSYDLDVAIKNAILDITTMAALNEFNIA